MENYNFEKDNLDYLMKKTIQRVKNKKLRISENQLIDSVSRIPFLEIKESFSDLIFEPFVMINFDNKLSFKKRKLKKLLKKIQKIVSKKISTIICEQNKDAIKSFFDEGEKGRQLMEILLSAALKKLIYVWPIASILLKSSIGEKIIDFLLDLIANQLDRVIETGVDEYCKI